MILKTAEINNDGATMLQTLAATPQLLEEDFKPEFDQLYIPGISVPSVKKLKKPFNVPIFGDNESITLSIDYPRKQNAGFYKRIRFVGMLAAEEITIGWPLTMQNFDDDTEDIAELFMFDEYDPKHYNEAIDDAYNKYTGDWGGFLHASTILNVKNVSESGDVSYEVISSEAGFAVMEDEPDFDSVHKILESGNASAADIVSVIRMPHLGKLLFK
jgi:hypothetical protein